MPQYTYTIQTDAVLAEIMASTADEAAMLFAASEFAGSHITTVGELFAEIEHIGDGAWCWIESDDAPDGQRQRSQL